MTLEVVLWRQRRIPAPHRSAREAAATRELALWSQAQKPVFKACWRDTTCQKLQGSIHKGHDGREWCLDPLPTAVVPLAATQAAPWGTR